MTNKIIIKTLPMIDEIVEMGHQYKTILITK